MYEELASYDVRPYDYGNFNAQFNIKNKLIGGGAFDYDNNMLYLAIKMVDYSTPYAAKPIIVAYKFTPPLNNPASNIQINFSPKQEWYLVEVHIKNEQMDIDWTSLKVHLVFASQYDELGEGAFDNGIVACKPHLILTVKKA